MGVAFNAAVVNEFNKNGDGIDTKTAIESVQQFIHKPTFPSCWNLEHVFVYPDITLLIGRCFNSLHCSHYQISSRALATVGNKKAEESLAERHN